MKNIKEMTDEELIQFYNQKSQQQVQKENVPVGGELSSLSDEELINLYNQKSQQKAAQPTAQMYEMTNPEDIEKAKELYAEEEMKNYKTPKEAIMGALDEVKRNPMGSVMDAASFIKPHIMGRIRQAGTIFADAPAAGIRYVQQRLDDDPNNDQSFSDLMKEESKASDKMALESNWSKHPMSLEQRERDKAAMKGENPEEISDEFNTLRKGSYYSGALLDPANKITGPVNSTAGRIATETAKGALAGYTFSDEKSAADALVGGLIGGGISSAVELNGFLSNLRLTNKSPEDFAESLNDILDEATGGKIPPMLKQKLTKAAQDPVYANKMGPQLYDEVTGLVREQTLKANTTKSGALLTPTEQTQRMVIDKAADLQANNFEPAVKTLSKKMGNLKNQKMEIINKLDINYNELGKSLDDLLKSPDAIKAFGKNSTNSSTVGNIAYLKNQIKKGKVDPKHLGATLNEINDSVYGSANTKTEISKASKKLLLEAKRRIEEVIKSTDDKKLLELFEENGKNAKFFSKLQQHFKNEEDFISRFKSRNLNKNEIQALKDLDSVTLTKEGTPQFNLYEEYNKLDNIEAPTMKNYYDLVSNRNVGGTSKKVQGLVSDVAGANPKKLEEVQQVIGILEDIGLSNKESISLVNDLQIADFLQNTTLENISKNSKTFLEGGTMMVGGGGPGYLLMLRGFLQGVSKNQPVGKILQDYRTAKVAPTITQKLLKDLKKIYLKTKNKNFVPLIKGLQDLNKGERDVQQEQ